MEKDYYIAENRLNKGKNNRIDGAQNSLNNYINQLKLHFDLNDKDVFKILEFTAELYKKDNKVLKKWWHIWK